jgi:hypothetical protein
MSDRVARRLRRIAWEYGKTGLLIDDSPECVTRIARALYGSDSLPPWWVLVRSINCACNALDELYGIFSDLSFRSLRGLVLVDRYLLLNCGQAGTVPWDDSREVPSEQLVLMRERVDRIVKLAERSIEKGLVLGEKPALLIRFLTSFPILGEQSPHLNIPGGQNFSKITWQTRSTELLQHERRQFQDSDDWRYLLQFGPKSSARVKQDAPPADLIDARTATAAKWRAETWDDNLRHLAQMFKDRRRMILITGAGSSIRCGPTSPGMLTTDKIVRRICKEIRDGDAGKSRFSDLGVHAQELDCACQPEPAGTAGDGESHDTAPGVALSPIRRLIEQVSANPEGWLDFKLEEVCDRKKHEGSIEEFKLFHRLFRRELYRRDFGFAYHHWLMARLRWTAIITTNFDGFHERAAASVARRLPQSDQARLWALSLGSVAHDWRDRNGEDPFQRREKRGALGEHRLFKPYGSLYSPSGELLLSNDEIDALQSEFRIALETALRLEEPVGAAAPGAIVVVGHSMRDELVGRALQDLERVLERFELVWVDPAAYDRCERPKMVWEQWLSLKKKERALTAERDKALYGGAEHYNQRECSGSVPARALDFIFDLWSHLRLYDEL